ncbi:MAG TPA: hypothetical protein VM840_03330 [Actinomycetota bacterium]|jgi:hypothetical protein|nr:hypothetical protein [Actinomycetota bacterium]
MRRILPATLVSVLCVLGSAGPAAGCPDSSDPGVQEHQTPVVAGQQVSAGAHAGNRLVVHQRTGASYLAVDASPDGLRIHGARTKGADSPGDTPLTRAGAWAADVHVSAAPKACAGSPANDIVIRIP